jgi:hypothetical protein
MLGASVLPTVSLDEVAAVFPVQPEANKETTIPAVAMAARERLRCFEACVIAFITFVSGSGFDD